MRKLTLLYPLILSTPHADETTLSRILLFLALILVAVAGTVIQTSEFREARLLQSEGVIVATQPIAKYQHCKNGICTYTIDYTFITRPGEGERRYSDSESVSRDFYHSTAEGALLQIIYIARSPDVNQIHALYVPGKSSYTGTIVGSVLFLPLFALWLWQTLDAQNARRLDNEGVLVASSVEGRCTQEHLGPRPNYHVGLGRRPMYDEIDNGPSYVFKNSYYIIFDLPGVGLVRQGVDQAIYEKMTEGKSISLRYLPDNPWICRLEW